MSHKAGETLAQTVAGFLSINIKKSFAMRRSYDKWAWKQIFADKKRKICINGQRFRVVEHAAVGSDLAVARFVVETLHGRVKNETGKWITKYRELPSDYCDSFKLTGIDASKVGLVTEGIDNFVGLDHLETLDLSGNPYLDDFACDQLSRQFRNSQTLNSINLSHNPLISVYGLEILLRIPSLQDIIARKTQASKFADIDLFALAAEDECGCNIFVHDDGRQYKLQELENLRTTKNTKLESGLGKKLIST